MTDKRILVVDDEPNVVKSCTRFLELAGFDVSGVSTGPDALELNRADPFELVLLDLRLGDMDGLEVLRTLREESPETAVVICTAYGTKENVVEALRLGAQEFLEKPLEANELVDAVSAILDREDDAHVRGNLRTLSLPSIVQINCTEFNQARLRLRRRGQEGAVYFAEGNIVHAILGSHVGEEAVYELLAWEDGEFELEMGVEAPERTITTNWSGLLLEGMRRIDEAAADLDGLDELEEYTEVDEMAKLQDVMKEMADNIPGFISADVVGMDGLSIAGYSSKPDFDAEAASAQFALVMKLVQRTAAQLDSGEVEDNLVTTEHAYILTRFLGDSSYYLGVAVDKDMASLGNVRLMARQYAGDLWDAIPGK